VWYVRVCRRSLIRFPAQLQPTERTNGGNGRNV
jgi:hypothetical protein